MRAPHPPSLLCTRPIFAGVLVCAWFCRGILKRVRAPAPSFACCVVQTGWKYFGNVMDSAVTYGKEDLCPVLCGEESFGTGSDHVREKDGLWAVLAWLSILASYNTDVAKPFVHVKDIVLSHWKTYGRNYYCRYDYEGVDSTAAQAFIQSLVDSSSEHVGTSLHGYTVAMADEFTYTDPIDGTVARKQGWRRVMADGSRVVWRLSGTAGSGATIRMYLESYEADPSQLELPTAAALEKLVAAALELSGIAAKIGRESPTVIT
jgi:phosphoglucomutase|eukprot:COSAG01_NODE_3781_length_5700_cov_10.714872_4_plen_262_part_00